MWLEVVERAGVGGGLSLRVCGGGGGGGGLELLSLK